jgi:hypothetical protein
VKKVYTKPELEQIKLKAQKMVLSGCSNSSSGVNEMDCGDSCKEKE